MPASASVPRPRGRVEVTPPECVDAAYVKRRAKALGADLVGALYVLDEPTVGMHARDTDRLVETMEHLRTLGNSVIVVEHDMDVIRRADALIDLGPGAGTHGGEIVYAGPPSPGASLVAESDADGSAGRAEASRTLAYEVSFPRMTRSALTTIA